MANQGESESIRACKRVLESIGGVSEDFRRHLRI